MTSAAIPRLTLYQILPVEAKWKMDLMLRLLCIPTVSHRINIQVRDAATGSRSDHLRFTFERVNRLSSVAQATTGADGRGPQITSNGRWGNLPTLNGTETGQDARGRRRSLR